MAAVGVMSYPVRDSFNSYAQQYSQPSPQDFTQPRSTDVPGTSDSQPHDTASSQHAVSRASPSTASPEVDHRPFLPSISNLLGIADARRPVHDQALDARRTLKPPYEPQAHSYQDQSTSLLNASPTLQTSYKRRWDGSDVSSHSYADQQRGMKSHSRHSESGYDPYAPTRPYMGSPSAASDGSYYSPTSTMSVQPGVHAGQMAAPYPESALPAASQSTPNLPATNHWEHHHHYIGQSSQQGIYPPLPDRYICPTCNKAFSRPSSLKIHSHSHTGEKPFRCPHAGCGKAFSVKSNMKRHEKGCHRAQGQAHAGAQMDI